MRAINPKEMPKLPEGTRYWSRSTKRAGGMFHAHTIGIAVCGFHLETNKSEYADKLSDMQYWGVCPKCYAKANQ